MSDLVRSIDVIVAVALIVASTVAAQDRLTPEALANLRRVEDLSLGCGGRLLLYTVRTPDLAANRSTAAEAAM